MKLNKRNFFLFVWLCSLSITVSAQKTWDKPLSKWSKSDAIKILSDSPWAQTYQSRASLADASREQNNREQADTLRAPTLGSSARNLGTTPVLIRLHSALPTRQALIRLRQLEVGYDKMDEKQSADFDKANQGFINCAICQDYYVVTMMKVIAPSVQSVEEGLLQTLTLEQLKNNVWLLNEKGERRDLVQFNAPKGSSDMAVFYFARRDNKGAPFLTAKNKRFEFIFNSAFFDLRRDYAAILPRRFEFNVTKLIVDDNIAF